MSELSFDTNLRSVSPDRLREDADEIIRRSLQAVMPGEAVVRALSGKTFPGKIYLVAVGKAAWPMAEAALKLLPEPEEAIIITKYGHSRGSLPGCRIYEAGHPIPDKNSFSATEQALQLAEKAEEGDTVIFLLSGGGSALFELPLVPADELQDITEQLLKCGANIIEINTIRKRLSAVKGGKFALACTPAKIHAVILSDILGDPLDMIASGPVTVDHSTSEQAVQIVEKYHLRLSPKAKSLLHTETPKELPGVIAEISGNVRTLCSAAEKAALSLGYTPIFLTDRLSCQAAEAGKFFGSILKSHAADSKSLAFIAGGETVVRITGNGKGGRNQELALAASEELSGIKNTALFSIGSDGTDGPTDAAGGYVDGETMNRLHEKGLSLYKILADNDSYHALKTVGGLIITGPTGTNVNDLTVGLLRR